MTANPLKPVTFGLVIGSRADGTAQALHRRLANLFYNRLASYVSGHKVEDLTSGFRICPFRMQNFVVAITQAVVKPAEKKSTAELFTNVNAILEGIYGILNSPNFR